MLKNVLKNFKWPKTRKTWFDISKKNIFKTYLPLLCIIGIVGGKLEGNRGRPFEGILTDVLDYDPDADKWTKVGNMATARSAFAMSLVPVETADYCV